MTQRPRITLETLLGETDGLRRLASSLVADAAGADDLVQEAVLAALSGGPAVRENPGGWLRSTVRNLARQGYRSSAHRTAREDEVARPEATASASESVIAAERQRVLLEAIMELEEPNREAILARYIRGLAPRAIAAECDVSVPTVKKRIERGLGKLRVSLGDRFGEGGAWAVALLPLCREDARALLAKASTGIGGGTLVTGAAALVLASVGAAVWSLWPAPSTDGPGLLAQPMAEHVATAVEPELASPLTTPGMAPIGGAEREQVASAVAPSFEPEVTPVAAAPEPQVEVTLIALDGEPIRQTDVEWRSLEDDDGSGFASDAHGGGQTDENGTLWINRNSLGDVADAAWTLHGRQFLSIGKKYGVEESRDYLLAPAVRLSGHVLDSGGVPVAGATVSWQADPAVSLTLPAAARQAGFQSTQRSVLAAADGAFDVGLVPAAGLAMVFARLGRFESAMEESPASSEVTRRIVLKDRPAPKKTVRGRVERGDGTACAGAKVRCQYHEVEADTDGRFEIGVPYLGPSDVAQMSAQDAEGNFGFIEGSALESALKKDGPEVRLVVPDAMGSVHGTLEFTDGKPARFVQMVLLDGTSEGSSSRSMEQVGEAGLNQTDHEGRFILSRLLDRSYTLRFFTFEPLMVHDVTVEPAQSGPMLITLPDEPVTRSARGVVVDRSGEPVPGARVSLMVLMDAAGSYSTGRPDVAGQSLVTDEEGVFAFSSVPARGVKIQVVTDTLSHDVSASLPIESFASGDVQRVEVDPLCQVQISVADKEVTELGADDVDGKAMVVMSGAVGRTTHAWRIRRGENGEFPLLFLPKSAVDLRLYHGYRTLRTVPIQLERGGVNRFDL